MKIHKLLLWISGILVLSSCAPTPILQQQPTGTLPIDPIPSTPALPTPSPRVIYVTPRATAVDPSCVPLDGGSELEQRPFSEYPQTILEYLNTGVSLEELDESLHNLGIANLPLSSAEADLTGDEKLDRVVSIINPLSETVIPSGTLLIFTCSQGSYNLAYRQDSTLPDAPPATGAPGIRLIQDLDADGSAELITASPSCGASTCFEAFQVLDWDGSNFRDRLVGRSDDLPFPELQAVDPDGDGFYDLEVRSSGPGSVGAGPARGVLRVWEYLPAQEKWVPGEDQLLASNYRIHVLHDADRLASDGQYEAALRLYEQVASDDTLADYVDPALERANLAAYARYRSVVLYDRLGQTTQAAQTLDNLEDEFASDTPQRAYVELAYRFNSGFLNGGIAEGCRAARAYVMEHSEEILEPLGPQAFGYANRAYSPEDVCSW